MEKAKIEITRKDLPTYFLTIHNFDLSEYVYTLSNSEEFPHKVSTQSHSSTMVVKPRYGKETISVTYGDTLIWNNVSIGVISSSELLKMMEVEYE